MKNYSIIVLVVISLTCALAEAAPKKRTRNANRIGPYGAALLGYGSYSGDQSQNEQDLLDLLESQAVPMQNVGASTKDSDVGYQATFGYRFTRYFAAELGLVQYGELSSTASGELDFGTGFLPTKAKLAFNVGGPVVSGIGILPLNDKIELFGRLGYIFASSERELTTSVDGQSGSFGSAKGDSQNVVLGVGINWNVNSVYSVRAEFQKIDGVGEENRTGEEDITVAGIGIIVRF